MEALSSLPSSQSPQFPQSLLPVALLKPTRWQAAVMQPLRELCQALGVAALALGRLLAGVAGYADYLVAGRGRVLSLLESNPP